MGVPMVTVARTDAESARLITSNIEARDRPFIEENSRTPEGFYCLKKGTGLDHYVSCGPDFAEIADLIWWETSHPVGVNAKHLLKCCKRSIRAR